MSLARSFLSRLGSSFQTPQQTTFRRGVLVALAFFPVAVYLGDTVSTFWGEPQGQSKLIVICGSHPDRQEIINRLLQKVTNVTAISAYHNVDIQDYLHELRSLQVAADKRINRKLLEQREVELNLILPLRLYPLPLDDSQVNYGFTQNYNRQSSLGGSEILPTKLSCIRLMDLRKATYVVSTTVADGLALARREVPQTQVLTVGIFPTSLHAFETQIRKQKVTPFERQTLLSQAEQDLQTFTVAKSGWNRETLDPFLHQWGTMSSRGLAYFQHLFTSVIWPKPVVQSSADRCIHKVIQEDNPEVVYQQLVEFLLEKKIIRKKLEPSQGLPS